MSFGFGNIDDFKKYPEVYRAMKGEKLTAIDLFLGKTPAGKIPFSIEINGSTFTNSLSKPFSGKTINSDPDKRINLELNGKIFRFVDLTEILSANSFSVLNQLITKNKNDLVEIANRYEEGGRQFYNFLYDLVAITKTLDGLPTEFQSLANVGNNSELLMHNRVLLELASKYRSNHTIKLEQNRGGTKPDLFIDENYVEVKTVLSPRTNDQQSFEEFAQKFEEVVNKARNQVGKDGVIFIALFSGIMNSLFYAFYYEMKIKNIHDFDGWEISTTIPTIEKGKTIIVIPTTTAFVDYYLIFDTKTAISSVQLFAKSRHKIFEMTDRIMDYMKIQPPLRNGFPVGECGSGQISFSVG